MWPQYVIISGILLSVIAIKVPVDKEVEPTEELPIETKDKTQKSPVYYLPNDETDDSILLPPHRPEESEVLVEAPATYLLPPAPGKHDDYYYQPTQSEQTDWYPIVANNPIRQPVTPQLESDNHTEIERIPTYRSGKGIKGSPSISLPRNLVPPAVDAPNDFIIVSPPVELEEATDHTDDSLKIKQTTKQGSVFSKKGTKPYPKLMPVPYLLPPKNIPQKFYNPTKLYPKKFVNEFRPVPIPINQYSAESLDQVPLARPSKPLHPMTKVEGYGFPNEEKNIYLYEKAINKKNIGAANDGPVAQHNPESIEFASDEQDTSETNFRHPERNVYPSPIKQSPAPAPVKQVPSNGERTEFRVHGLKGPHSYQFGYDTGKGKNRQFRYEERDNDGHVKGHYGYADRNGKLRVVNYDADPEHGFRAEAPVDKE